jgi:hypothetical protein
VILIALALAAQTSAQPQGPWTKYSGPAILLIRRTNGRDFVPFSSFARCETARKMFEAEDAQAQQRNEAAGYKAVPGTAPLYRCIAG